MRALALAFLAPLLAIAGCGGGSTCEDAIANAAKVYGFGGEGYGGVRAKAIQECKDDKWNDALRSCVAAGKSRADIDGCEKLKTPRSSVEAYQDYMKKGKRSEAELNLNALQKSLKVHYIENAAFPTGTAPLTPAAPCCEGPNHKCPPSAGEWMNNPLWSALDFELSEPSYFQYSYESKDGQTAIAQAVGDLDCDMVTSTYELRCEAVQGNPSCTVTRPDRPD